MPPTPLPAHIALARYACPLGPLPAPTAADRAEAERIAAEEYADCPRHLAKNRDRIVSYFADCVMQKRMAAEHRAEQHSKRRAA